MTDTAPLVTVVTSTWARPQTLFRHAVRSVAKQTYPQIEHLVIIDGWDARLLGLLKAIGYTFEGPDKRVCYLGRNWSRFAYGPGLEPGKTLVGYGATARMVGAWSARGDYIAYLDDDNDWLPHHVEVMVEEIKRTKADFVTSAFRYVPGEMVAGGYPPGVGRTDTSGILHRAELLKLGSWRIEDGYEGDGRMCERWISKGAKWSFRDEPTVILHPYRHGAAD